MSGWGSWLAKVATTAVGEVAQFGKDYLDSVTSIDDEEEGTSTGEASRPKEESESQGGQPPAATASTPRAEAEGDSDERRSTMPGASSAGQPKATPVEVSSSPSVAVVEATSVSSSKSAEPSGKLKKKGLGGGLGGGVVKLSQTSTTKPKEAPAPAPASPGPSSAEIVSAEEPQRAEPATSAASSSSEGKAKEPSNNDGVSWGFSGVLNLVSKGADLALQLLPELDPASPVSSPTGSPAGKQRSPAEGEKGSPGADSSHATLSRTASQNESPLELLRRRRGQVELLRREREEEQKNSAAGQEEQTEAEKELEALVRGILNPLSLAEFDYQPDDMIPLYSWIATDTSIGRRIRTTRSMMTSLLNDEGQPISSEAVLTQMSTFPQICSDCAETIAQLVVEELAEVFAKDGTSSSEWFNHEVDSAGEGAVVAKKRAENTMALVTYAQCEMAEASRVLCELISESFLWARKADVPNLKEIKSTGLSLRGECAVASTSAVTILEEALECTQVLFPLPKKGSATSPEPQSSPAARQVKDASPSKSDQVPQTEIASPEKQPTPADEKAEEPASANDEAQRGAVVLSASKTPVRSTKASPGKRHQDPMAGVEEVATDSPATTSTSEVVATAVAPPSTQTDDCGHGSSSVSAAHTPYAPPNTPATESGSPPALLSPCDPATPLGGASLSIGESLETTTAAAATTEKCDSEAPVKKDVEPEDRNQPSLEAEAAPTPETTPQTAALEPNAPNAGKGKGKKKKGGK